MATVIAIVLMALMLRAPNLRRYMRLILITFISFVILYALVILKIVPQLNILLEPVMALSGKDATFSNRSEIWAIINEHIQKNPLIGSGYGAYWIGPFAWSPSYEFVTRMYFYPTESHNGYLEIVNDLGFVGLLCLLGYLAVHVRQCLLLFKLDAAQGALHLSLFCLLLVVNLSESCWLSPNAPLSLIVMTLSTVSVARCLLDRRLHATFGAPRQTA
jgi:O-antigen ligase